MPTAEVFAAAWLESTAAAEICDAPGPATTAHAEGFAAPELERTASA